MRSSALTVSVTTLASYLEMVVRSQKRKVIYTSIDKVDVKRVFFKIEKEGKERISLLLSVSLK
jgi:hypothetical protein